MTAGTAYLYRVCGADAAGECVTTYSNLTMATAYSFADDPIVTYGDHLNGINTNVEVTAIRAMHVTQLREAVNAVRRLAGLSDFPWINLILTVNVSPISADDVRDLRTALEGALTALGISLSSYTDPTIFTGLNGVWTTVKRDHIKELRTAATRQNSAGAGGAASPRLQWLVADQLGTPRMVIDQTGSLSGVRRHEYLPFGEELFAGTGGRTTTQGYAADNVRQKFTSKERDGESGLDYFRARYYSSIQGRFTSADEPFADQSTGRAQSWNLYSYVRNNPLRATDPTGRRTWEHFSNALNGYGWRTDDEVRVEETVRRLALLSFSRNYQLNDGRYYFSKGSPAAPLTYIDIATATREDVWRAYDSLANDGGTFDESDLNKVLRSLPALEGVTKTTPSPDPSPVFGQNGSKMMSNTVWHGEGQERIDVENPNPGQRPGQIHYQDNAGNKYLYDPGTKTFRGAPNSVNRLLDKPTVQYAINKALRFLGEQ